MSNISKWPRSKWGIIASIAYFLGAAISFCSATRALERGTTPEELISLLTIYIVIGLSVSGVGQLMSAAAHGAVSRGGRRVDGWGKAVGLFGWSLGLVGAVMFAMKGTDAPEWLMEVAVAIFIFAPGVTFIVSVLTRSEPKSSSDSCEAGH